MNIKNQHGNVKSENTNAIILYQLGFSVAQIANIQDRFPGTISSAILRAKKRSPDAFTSQKKYNFASERQKHKIKSGSLIPTITQDLCSDIQRWIITKTIEGKYDSIASFFTDLAGEAYFADQ